MPLAFAAGRRNNAKVAIVGECEPPHRRLETAAVVVELHGNTSAWNRTMPGTRGHVHDGPDGPDHVRTITTDDLDDLSVCR